jgi:asparagine synthase (glutamine-hydrolysing)
LGLATTDGVINKDSLKKVETLGASTILAYKKHKIDSLDTPQPINQYGYSFAFDGRLWYLKMAPDILTVANILENKPKHGIKKLINKIPGSYAIIILSKDAIYCGRDSLGTIPLYYAEGSDFFALATCKKMIWSVGLEANSFPPGYYGEFTTSGMYIERIKTIDYETPRNISMSKAVNILDEHLTRVVNIMSKGLFRISLGFSGGIDSCILAHYLKKNCKDVNLVCVGIMNSRDFSNAEKAADFFNLSLRMKSYTLKDVEENLDAVLWAIEEPDPMKTAVALPLYWAAKIASDSGSRIFFSGNGSDELFGGYKKYITEYIEKGETVRETLYNDVVKSYEVNYERDHKICMEHGIELRLPFADHKLVKFGLSLPIHLKLSPEHESPRKLILRKLAEKLGFPKDIVYKPKRAIQYSTGVNKSLIKISKRNGNSLPEFLRNRFSRIKKERLGDNN